MNDYRYIKTEPGRSRDTINTCHTLEANRQTVAFLERAPCEPFDGETVVVTHHTTLRCRTLFAAEVVDQDADRDVQLGEREEAPITQPRQNPSLNDENRRAPA